MATEALLDKLATQLSESRLIRPNDEGYEDALARWSKAASKPAAAVLLAKHEVDISKTVVFCRDHHIDLAVRSGGHSTSGASSSEGGIVIDLTPMRQVSVDVQRETISAQGGCNWGDVDEAGALHGLAAVGGAVYHTGVGGLTLGGGYGWLSGLHGLVVDNLLSVRVVLANGEIIDASESNNQDLFWAIRGAGHNFGVVVNFVFRAHNVKEFWGGILIFRPSQLASIVDFLNGTMFGLKGLGGANLGLTTGGPTSGSSVVVTIVYFGPPKEAESIFAPLQDLGPLVDTLKSKPYPLANKIFDAPFGFRTSMRGGIYRHPLRTEFVRKMMHSLETFSNRIPDAKQSTILFEWYDSRQLCQNANIDMSFNGRSPHNNMQVVNFWTNPSHDADCRQFARDICQSIDQEFNSGGLAATESPVNAEHSTVYGNYDHSDAEPQAKHLFGENYPRLQQLKTKFDQENLFNKLHPIAPIDRN